MAEQDAAGEVRAGHAVARVAEREQVMRESCGAGRCNGRPSAVLPYGASQPYAGQDAGDVRIDRGQLVHQLTGALNDRLVAQPRRQTVAVGAAHQQAVVVHPADDVRRRRRIADDHLAAGRACGRTLAGTRSVSTA